MTNKKIYIEYWWLIFIVIIAIFRLFVTGDRNILALNSPHDEFWYIHTAYNNIWGGTYDQMSFIHLPIYSAWLALLHFFGIPARLGIDVSWLLAIGYLAYATHRLTRTCWLAALLFSFLAFHPYTISIFDRALAETFLTVVSAAVIGAGIELWNCRDEESVFSRRIAFVVFAAGVALAFHTRKEGIVLVVPLLMLACWSWFDRHRWWYGLGKLRMAMPLLIVPILTTLFLGAILAGGNYLKYGVLARYELAAPGYLRAVATLNRIDAGRTPRHFTVTKEVLFVAYKESTTFRELQPFMEGWPGQMWLSISSQNTGISGEIGNGWFLWALRDVAAQAGWHKNARLADSKYAAVADELEKAFAAGRLKEKGFTISSFLDPDVAKWLPEMPQSIFNVLQLVARPRLQDLELPRESASTSQLEMYVVITGRRTDLSDSDVVVGVNGWTIMPAGTLVGLGTTDNTFSWTRLSGPQRPDVPGAYAFSISTSSDESPTELHIQSPDGEKGSIALNTLKAQETSTFTGAIRAEVGIDSLEYSKVFRANKWLSKLCTGYQYIGYVFCLAAMCGLFLLMVRRSPPSALALVIGVVIVVVTVRVALFSIIDASSFNAIQARYMLPVIPAFACMGVFSLALLSEPYGK